MQLMSDSLLRLLALLTATFEGIPHAVASEKGSHYMHMCGAVIEPTEDLYLSDLPKALVSKLKHQLLLWHIKTKRDCPSTSFKFHDLILVCF